MKTICQVTLFVFAALFWMASPSAVAGELIYSRCCLAAKRPYGPSLVWPADGVNGEVADEFNVVASIDRVSAGGFIWGSVNFQGVHVRFYEFGADNKPGALQREYFLQRPAIQTSPSTNSQAKLTRSCRPLSLPPGGNFLSVQPVINYWYWWSSSSGTPRGEAFYFRNNTTGQAWHHGDDLNFNINADVVFFFTGR